ncbi:protein SCO1/2 [Marmoricola sp. OAE513]|uniref:SCO family protein n=1 Tax=Marmoricola sp. OAE513 TaxID=2817894 RepID=UPI001AE60682
MNPKRVLVAVAAAVTALTLLSACGGEEKGVDIHGTVLDASRPVAADELTTTDGGTFSLVDDSTKPLTLVFFGYTRCPDICPAVMSSVAAGLTKLSDAQRKQVQLVFVTTDPKRDTDKVLADYVSRFDPSFRALTGDIRTISKVALSLGVFVDKGEALPGGGYDPNSHGANVIGINAEHRALIAWDGETSPSQFASDFEFLVTKKPDRLEGPNG